MKHQPAARLANFIDAITLGSLPASFVEQIRCRVLNALAMSLTTEMDKRNWTPNNIDERRNYTAQAGANALEHQQIQPALSALANGIMLSSRYADEQVPAEVAQIDSAILPAAWAVVESRQGDGQSLMEALAAGYATTAVLFDLVRAQAIPAWQVGVTTGTVGAAAAAAKASSLSAGATLDAMGFAAGLAKQAAWDTQNAQDTRSTARSQVEPSRSPGRPGSGKAAMDGVLSASMAWLDAHCPPALMTQLQMGMETVDAAFVLSGLRFPTVQNAGVFAETEAVAIQRFSAEVSSVISVSHAQALIGVIKRLELASSGELMAYITRRDGYHLHS